MKKYKKKIEDFANYIANLGDVDLLIKTKQNISKITIPNVEIGLLDYCNKISLFKNFFFKLCVKRLSELTNNTHRKYRIKSYLKRKITTSYTLTCIENKLGVIERNIGVIPRIFFLKVDNKRDAAIGLYDILSEYSTKLNYIYTDEAEIFEKYSEVFQLDKHLMELSNQLSNLLNQTVRVEYYTHGCNGNAFKLFIKDKIFIYKTFYPYFYCKRYMHGAGFEIQSALFANYNSRKSRFVKFYFGYMGSYYNFDAFMVCEFAERNKNSGYNTHIDYLTTKDASVRNIIANKIIDFGGLEENIKALSDKKLRKLLRIMCNYIIYKYDKDNLKISFEIRQQGMNIIKNTVKKYEPEVFNLALKLLNKHISFPGKLRKYLKNINVVNEINCSVQIMLKNLIKTNIKSVKKVAKDFHLNFTDSEPLPQYNFNDGSMIIDLPHDHVMVYFYDITGNIYRIKFEKNLNNVFVNIFDFNRSDIENFIKSNNNLFVSDLINNNAVIK